MPTPEQIAEATRVAQEAAQKIGGTFQQGVGFTPGAEKPEDPNLALVRGAAKAGVKVSDLGGLLSGPGPSESRDRIAKQFGYGSFDELASSAFAPSTSTQKLYREAYRASGLADIKKKIESRREDLNRATSAINDNPWLSEASRSGKLRTLQELAYADINQFNDLYTQGLSEVGRVTQQSAADLAQDRATRQQQLNFMLKLAEEEDQIAREKMLAGYLPDYFDALPAEAGEGFTLGEGQSRYNADGTLVAGPGNGTGGGTYNFGNVNAKQLADAISAAESGGDFNAPGASGERGAFQFMPATWQIMSRKYAGRPLPQTPENERLVAEWKIGELLAQGYSPREVALIWNTSLGGAEKPFVRSGTNDKGVAYDSGAYAERVLGHLAQIVPQVPALDPKEARKVLSIEDAKSLDVPYGTTVGEAAAMRLTPGAAEKEQERAAQTEKALGILKSLKTIRNHPGLNNAVGPNMLVRPNTPLSGDKAAFIAEVERLANSLTLDNMKLLKGPATDKDVAIVASSVSRLKTMNVRQSEYLKEIERIEKAAQRIVKNLGLSGEQAGFYYGVSGEDLEEIDGIFGGSANSTSAFNPKSYY